MCIFSYVLLIGSWAGSAVWNAAQPNGLLTFDLNTCEYYLVVLDLKPKAEYAWKVTVNNAWSENYGCGGDCKFTSNSQGAVRFIVKPTGGVPKLSTDFNVAECGDGACEVGESCEFCPADCGTCPPPVCGDGVCEADENYVTCPADCTNELPGCDRFNMDSCAGGMLISISINIQLTNPNSLNTQSSPIFSIPNDNNILAPFNDVTSN
jgi:hypothetical protein